MTNRRKICPELLAVILLFSINAPTPTRTDTGRLRTPAAKRSPTPASLSA